MRHGQWVSWIGSVPGAHVTKDGRVVGVFHRTRDVQIDRLGNRARVADLVVPVSKDEGGPLPSGEGLANLQFFADQVLDLRPILDRADIPQERLKNNPTWTPRP